MQNNSTVITNHGTLFTFQVHYSLSVLRNVHLSKRQSALSMNLNYSRRLGEATSKSDKISSVGIPCQNVRRTGSSASRCVLCTDKISSEIQPDKQIHFRAALMNDITQEAEH